MFHFLIRTNWFGDLLEELVKLSILTNNLQGASTLISRLIITTFRYGSGFRYYSETVKQKSTVICLLEL